MTGYRAIVLWSLLGSLHPEATILKLDEDFGEPDRPRPGYLLEMEITNDPLEENKPPADGPLTKIEWFIPGVDRILQETFTTEMVSPPNNGAPMDIGPAPGESVTDYLAFTLEIDEFPPKKATYDVWQGTPLFTSPSTSSTGNVSVPARNTTAAEEIETPPEFRGAPENSLPKGPQTWTDPSEPSKNPGMSPDPFGILRTSLFGDNRNCRPPPVRHAREQWLESAPVEA